MRKQNRRKWWGVSALFLMIILSLVLPIAVFGERTERNLPDSWYTPLFQTTNDTVVNPWTFEHGITIVCPWGVDGGADSTIRPMARLLEEYLGVPVEVRNETGESGVVGATYAYEQKADGYTFLLGTQSLYLQDLMGKMEFNFRDYSSLNGKKIGVNKGSVQEKMFRSWATKKGIQADIVEVVESEAESVERLERGEMDAYITIDGFGGSETLAPVFKIGASDIYFAVSKSSPGLLRELDSAMLRIQDENSNYTQQLADKYFQYSGVNKFLTENERSWLSKHGAIRVGYLDDELPFCAQDKGELTGALKEFLDLASHCV